MSRPSSSALAVPTVAHAVQRLQPPRGMPQGERAFWTAAVDAMPPGHFTAIDAPALTAWAEHSALAGAFREALRGIPIDDPRAPQLSAQAVLHQRMALGLARALRITLNARADRDASATAARRGARQPASLEQIRQRYLAEAAARDDSPDDPI